MSYSPEHALQTRARIIKSARCLFNRHGFEQVTIDQIMAAAGFAMALAVVLTCRLTLGDADFKAWGWRIPFLLSALLVALSIIVRMRLMESPVFAHRARAIRAGRLRLPQSAATIRPPSRQSPR